MTLILCALFVGYVCGRLTDKWRTWRAYKQVGGLG